MVDTMDNAALILEIARLKAENEQLRPATRKLSFKVGAKGGVSVYGLNVRFPVTLYKEQWERLIAATPELQAFLKAHDAELKVKGATVPAVEKA